MTQKGSANSDANSRSHLSASYHRVVEKFKQRKAAFRLLPVLCKFLKVIVLINGVMMPQVEQLLQSLVDENDADQRCESFLGEARDVTDKRTGIRGHQQQTEEGRPQANAGPQGEVGEAILPERDR